MDLAYPLLPNMETSGKMESKDVHALVFSSKLGRVKELGSVDDTPLLSYKESVQRSEEV